MPFRMPVLVKPSFIEPCTCGSSLETVNVTTIFGRFETWYCTECGRQLAGTMLSDSPLRNVYASKRIIKGANAVLRAEKGLPKKVTKVTAYDKDGKIVPWKEIEKYEEKWERRVGAIRR